MGAGKPASLPGLCPQPEMMPGLRPHCAPGWAGGQGSRAATALVSQVELQKLSYGLSCLQKDVPPWSLLRGNRSSKS